MLLYVTLGEEGVFLSWAFYRALLMAVSIQLAANCANTYFDFKLTPLYTPPSLLLLLTIYIHRNGFDTVDHRQSKYRLDRALANGLISEEVMLASLILYYAISFLCILSCILSSSSSSSSFSLQLLSIYVAGFALSFFYTGSIAGIGGLKYKAFGDLSVFLSFGPMLMQCVSLMLVHAIKTELFVYSIPLGLLTAGIMHANNSRDIATDTGRGDVFILRLFVLVLTFFMELKWLYF